MDRDEQNEFLSKWYAEANRYMDNAKEALKKAIKDDDGFYKDDKYVKSACGIAYLGVLVAVDKWLTLKGVEEPGKGKHKKIEFYTHNVAQIDNKLLNRLNTAYNILHLEGYYRGEKRIKIIDEGFNMAYEIIDKIKPETFVPVKETRAQMVKRTLNNLLVSFAVMFR